MYCTDTDFANWAFGADLWSKFMVHDADVIDLMEDWNKLHGDLLRLDGGDSIKESCVKMKKLYEEHENKSTK
jgi:hypothetical protein